MNALQSPAAWFEIAARHEERPKVAMLACACAFQAAEATDEASRTRAVEGICRLSRFTEMGSVRTAAEVAQLRELDAAVQRELLKDWSEELRRAVYKEWAASGAVTRPTPLFLRQRFVARCGKEDVELQPGFSWVIPFHLAASARPQTTVQLEALAHPSIGIKHIFTLTETPLPPTFRAAQPSLRFTHLPVDDYQAPSLDQLHTFIRLTAEEEGPVLVHCLGGIGRAGTFLAAYLIRYGNRRASLDSKGPAMTPEEALERLRAIRSGSVETDEQEEVLDEFFHDL
ncbi:hypothetical protein JCM10207_002260 [Rhodosporidiobolus poonsookiae]